MALDVSMGLGVHAAVHGRPRVPPGQALRAGAPSLPSPEGLPSLPKHLPQTPRTPVLGSG